MGCHLGWHFPAGCPLWGGSGEFKQPELLFHQKQFRKNITYRNYLHHHDNNHDYESGACLFLFEQQGRQLS
jgi:hypothetical protein